MITDNNGFRVTLVLPKREKDTPRLIDVEHLLDESPVENLRSVHLYAHGATFTGCSPMGGETIARFEDGGEVRDVELDFNNMTEIASQLGPEILIVNLTVRPTPLKLKCERLNGNNHHRH